jgi:hypothetical protein
VFGGTVLQQEVDVSEATAQPDEEAGSRPLSVIVLAILCGVALVLAVVHLLQALAIVPYFIGPIAIHDFNWWYSLMWISMIWLWSAAIRAVWTLDTSAPWFVLIVAGFNVLFDFSTMALSPNGTTDLSASFIVSLVIFGFAILPSTKHAFAVD